MRFLIDMNLSPEWVGFLTAHGHEAEHWRSVGDPEDDDPRLAAHAGVTGAVIITCDIDFPTLLARTGARQPSIILVRAARLQPEDIGDSILRVVAATEHALASGAVVTFDGRRGRARLLPL